MAKKQIKHIIENGDIYFFYRKKMNVERPESVNDLRRMHIVIVPDNNETKRVYMVGKKRMPIITKGKQTSQRREWALNVLSNKNPTEIKEELGPIEYQTKTRGKRHEPTSIPAAEGRYQIFDHDGHTELAYKIQNPEKESKALKELQIHKEASYIISVKNPDIKIRGFNQKNPNYPKELKNKFAGKRWINIDDPHFLDYENTQLLLIGARDNLNDLDLKIKGKANLFKNLKLEKKNWPTETLETGKFTTEYKEKEPSKPRSSRTKGGERGGKKALKTSSAAGIAKTIKGINFPAQKKDLINYAKDKHANNEIINTLKQMPDKKYNTMADVEKKVGEVR
ncbi:MAG: DUF2795 domain-containing protein [Nanoarchaeota archaeon]